MIKTIRRFTCAEDIKRYGSHKKTGVLMLLESLAPTRRLFSHSWMFVQLDYTKTAEQILTKLGWSMSLSYE